MSRKVTKSNNGENTPMQLPPEVATILKDIPEEKRKTLIKALTFSVSQHMGPLPDGGTLTIYNQQIPDGGNRIMATVEKQLDHRMKLETIGLGRSLNQSSTGQWMAFIIALFFGAASWHLALNDHEIIAGVIGGIDIIGLVTVFIVGRSGNKK